MKMKTGAYLLKPKHGAMAVISFGPIRIFRIFFKELSLFRILLSLQCQHTQITQRLLHFKWVLSLKDYRDMFKIETTEDSELYSYGELYSDEK